jgi:hypothetical protein
MWQTKVRVPYRQGSGDYVVLLDGPKVPYGLIKLRNVGDYGLGVGALDANGNNLKEGEHVYLDPGDACSSYVPPANAVKIFLVGQKQPADQPAISGETVLEWDVPWYS